MVERPVVSRNAHRCDAAGRRSPIALQPLGLLGISVPFSGAAINESGQVLFQATVFSPQGFLRNGFVRARVIQISFERGNPGSLMRAYNKVNGEDACGNDNLLNKQIKDAIGFKGFVCREVHRNL